MTFKDIDGLDFASAYDQLVFTISDLYQKYSFCWKAKKLMKKIVSALNFWKSGEGSKILVIRSLSLLMRLLENYYHKQMILLIDEYDVPIAKSQRSKDIPKNAGNYQSMMSTALKR